MRIKGLSWSILFAVMMLITGLLSTAAHGFYYDNPAEEAFSTTKFELVIPQISLEAKNNLFTLENLNIDLTDPAAKEQFFNRMAGGTFRADFHSQLNTGLTIGRFSVHLRPWASGSLRLASGIPELVFVGFAPNDNGTPKTYDLAGTKVNGLAGVSLDFKYGRPIRLDRHSELGVGVTLRYVKGLTMANSEVTSGYLTSFDQEGKSKVKLDGRSQIAQPPGSNGNDFSFGDFFSASAGSGFLADLGVAYSRDPWRAGLVLKNIGAITWKNVEQRTYSYDGTVTTGPDGPEFNKDQSQSTEEVTVLSSYKTSLPLVLQAQGSYRFLGSFYGHLGIETGLGDGWGISSSPRLWTSLEWKPRRLIRMAGGISYQERHLNYNALLELRLFCLWLNLKLDWMHDFGGLNASTMLALHF